MDIYIIDAKNDWKIYASSEMLNFDSFAKKIRRHIPSITEAKLN